MKEADAALRKRFREQGFPYFSYRYGEKARGICRIGKWEERDWRKEEDVIVKTKRNVTPTKMLKVIKTFTRFEREYLELHLWLEPLSEPEQQKWKAAFAEENIIYDTT